jgi:DNA modification methylase
MKLKLPTRRQPFALQRGSCYDLIKSLPDNSIDFICTDPPYNLGSYSTGNIELSWRADFNNDIAEWDSGQFHPSLLKDEFLRVLKPTGNIFAFTSYNLLGPWHETFDPLFDTFQFMVWHKTNPPPKFRRAGFLNSCELIVCMWNKGHTWNFSNQRDMHNFIESPICGGNERLKSPKHPTQKPVAILKRLIEIASNPGDLVLDPFAGVGSTGVAAISLNRRFIGFELEEDYATAAVSRIEATSNAR